MIWACGNAPAGSEERQTCTWKQTASNLPAGFVVSAGPCPPCDWALCAEAAGGGCELLWWRTCCQVGLEGSSPAALGPCLWWLSRVSWAGACGPMREAFSEHLMGVAAEEPLLTVA